MFSPKKLSLLSVEVVAKNFDHLAEVISELKSTKRDIFMNALTFCDLPLETAVCLIEDETYWQSLFKIRWPNVNPYRDISSLHKPKACPTWWLNTWDLKSNSKQISYYLELFQQASYNFGFILQTANRFLGPAAKKRPKENETETNIDIAILSNIYHRGSLKPEPCHIKSWRTCYLEKFLEDYLENLHPRNYNLEEMHVLSKILSNNIISLRLNQMQSDLAIESIIETPELFDDNLEIEREIDFSSIQVPLVKYNSLPLLYQDVTGLMANIKRSSSDFQLCNRYSNVAKRKYVNDKDLRSTLMRWKQISRSLVAQKAFGNHESTKGKSNIANPTPTNNPATENISEVLLSNTYTPKTNILSYLNALKRSPIDHIPFTILSTLQNLTELSLYFGTQLGSNYNKSFFTITEIDCKNLGYNLARTKLKILCINRTDLNCRKLNILLSNLAPCKTLQVLDFSHCAIENVGSGHILAFLATHPYIHTLVLCNNQITTLSEKFFEHQALRYFDVKLNPLQRGEHCEKEFVPICLELINVSSCNLSERDTIFISNILKSKTLLQLDLSNNRLTNQIGELILGALNRNDTIESLDLRFCGIDTLIEHEIKTKLFNNCLRKFAKEQRMRIKEIDSLLNYVDVSESEDEAEVL